MVTTAEAEALWRGKKAVFFDVMPNTPKPTNLPAGTIWRDKVRKDIPGSIWLANVGYGAISEETANYFRHGLAAAAGTDKSRAILFYCMTNCWISWNAAKTGSRVDLVSARRGWLGRCKSSAGGEKTLGDEQLKEDHSYFRSFFDF
ncbi:hypothetical protein RQ479_12055 [Mesorhizobium sp. ISC25]|uniref:hypothetical protein n=1 Tax=Mesorhizobium sp. ISC25 TaxID=3077335 RepID=UPI0035DE7D63